MNFKIVLLAVVFSAFLVKATPSHHDSRHHHKRHHCRQIYSNEYKTTTPKTTPSTTTTTTPTTTTTTTPTTTTTTTLKPDVTACSYLYQINSSSGTYLKTICYIELSYNTSQAANYCKNIGMSLFGLTDEISVYGYQDFLTAYCYNSCPLIITNAYSNASDIWVLYTDPSVPLYDVTGGMITEYSLYGNLPANAVFTLISSDPYSSWFRGSAVDPSFAASFSCEFR